MINEEAVVLTYVLANGDEKTVQLNQDSFSEFMKWYLCESSSNPYDLGEEPGAKTTLFKDTLLSVRY